MFYRWKDEAEQGAKAALGGKSAAKEEEVWTAEYRNVQEARASIARWIQEYNYDRPHRGIGNRTPHEAFLSFATVLKTEAQTV